MDLELVGLQAILATMRNDMNPPPDDPLLHALQDDGDHDDLPPAHKREFDRRGPELDRLIEKLAKEKRKAER